MTPNMPMAEFLEYWANLGWREYVRHIGVYAFVAAMLAMLGPFGTYEDPFLWRFSYWFFMLAFFGGLIMPLVARLAGHVRYVTGSRVLSGAFLLLFLAAIPMAIFVRISDLLLYNWIRVATWLPFGDVAQIRAGVRVPEALGWAGAIALYGNVYVIVLISIGVVSAFVINRHTRNRKSLPLESRPGVAFFSRLPDHIGTDLIYLQMEDHYLRVVTKGGQALILMRFRDAVQELAEVGGTQVHRSWWVSNSHVLKLSRSKRRFELLMSNQARVPVSSSYKKKIEEMFLSETSPS